ncbi:hypothetical protein [Lyngbya sp. CCY1209]|uniref:hypothetical protein n=1 Tax=Lyngbya sp. CCY1209 TaxID=2886103 RepID=UPI002D2001F6|nr:hypothetical protein [Lyngbya sp. CCY1209]MEB3885947.1 hypothetical protein [Lyngbya sp. CCY1209]
MMQGTLGVTPFDRCVINMSLIHLCDRESYVSQEMQKRYTERKRETNEAIDNPWLELHQFTILIPHPDREYEDTTLDLGLTHGYNIEVEPVGDRATIPYPIPEGGHFVILLKQNNFKSEEFLMFGTGIFVRPLGILSLDIVGDRGESKPVIIKHPIIREYPPDWEQKLKRFLNGEMKWNELPSPVGYVDRAYHRDYRPPTWNEMALAARGLAGF